MPGALGKHARTSTVPCHKESLIVSDLRYRTYVRTYAPPQEHHAYVTLTDFDSPFYRCEKGTTLLNCLFRSLRDIFVRGCYAIETRLLVENS